MIQLPLINGNFEAGLAVGTDVALDDSDKLPIPWPIDNYGQPNS